MTMREKGDFSKGYWNPKRKLGVTTHFSAKPSTLLQSNDGTSNLVNWLILMWSFLWWSLFELQNGQYKDLINSRILPQAQTLESHFIRFNSNSQIIRLCRSCWHQIPEKRPPASEILRQMEEPAFLCQCRIVPQTNEGLLEKVTTIHGLSHSGTGNDVN